LRYHSHAAKVPSHTVPETQSQGKDCGKFEVLPTDPGELIGRERRAEDQNDSDCEPEDRKANA